eukprot:scaffold1394_cov109-Isochrysis_galbana.AAC.23
MCAVRHFGPATVARSGTQAGASGERLQQRQQLDAPRVGRSCWRRRRRESEERAHHRLGLPDCRDGLRPAVLRGHRCRRAAQRLQPQPMLGLKDGQLEGGGHVLEIVVGGVQALQESTTATLPRFLTGQRAGRASLQLPAELEHRVRPAKRLVPLLQLRVQLAELGGRGGRPGARPLARRIQGGGSRLLSGLRLSELCGVPRTVPRLLRQHERQPRHPCLAQSPIEKLRLEQVLGGWVNCVSRPQQAQAEKPKQDPNAAASPVLRRRIRADLERRRHRDGGVLYRGEARLNQRSERRLHCSLAAASEYAHYRCDKRGDGGTGGRRPWRRPAAAAGRAEQCAAGAAEAREGRE